MTRRDYGTGSCYERSDGRWVYAFDAGWTAKGTRRRVTVTAKTKAEVLRKAKVKQRELDDGGGASGTTTVKVWAERWLTLRERDLRPKAFSALAIPIRRWVVPTIGARKLDKLTPADLRAVAEAQRAGGLAATSIHTTHKKMQQMLKAALVEGYTVPQRVLLLPAPPKGKHDRQAMPLDQAFALLQAAGGQPDGGLRWRLALVTGMRQAEILGLTRAAVDQEAGVVEAQWQLQELRWRDRRDRSLGFRVPDDYDARQLVDGYHLTRPKTDAGLRQFPLAGYLADELRGWLMVAPPNPWGLLWVSVDKRDGSLRPRTADDDRAEFYALQEAAGIHHPSGRHWYVHELRNNAITQMSTERIPDAIITALAGHTSIATSQGYMTAHADEKRKALELVDQAYRRPSIRP